MAISGTINLSVNITHTASHPQNDASHSPVADFSLALTSGTAAAQLQYYVGGTASAAGAAVTYDLAGGVTDIYGSTITGTRLMGLFIRNNGTASGEDLQLGNHLAHIPIFGATPDYELIAAGGLYFNYWNRGIAITGGTGDIIRLNPGSATIPYEYGFILA